MSAIFGSVICLIHYIQQISSQNILYEIKKSILLKTAKVIEDLYWNILGG